MTSGFDVDTCGDLEGPVIVIESTMYRKDIKVYIKQETVYDIYNSSLNSIRIDELY